MASVIYKYGLRAKYDSLTSPRDANTLYWCTDTRQLFKGDEEYGDGVRFATSYDLLPGVNFAAESKLYICRDTGCGYVLNEGKTDWVMIIHGVDNESLEYNPTTGLMQIKAVAMDKVTGLQKALDDIIAASTGGIRYKGSVPTYDDLPTDAIQGDLYEVKEDGSEWCWNGEQWIEYGSTSTLKELAFAEANKKEFSVDDGVLNIKSVSAEKVFVGTRTLEDVLPAVYEERKYEVTNGLFEDTRVAYTESEIRVMFTKDTVFSEVAGNGGDPNSYYVGVRAYAPDGAVNFREDLKETIEDPTLFDFTGDFAGVDSFGRKYSIVWLPAASKQADGSWKYFGDGSSEERMIGWFYTVEWYNANGKVIDSDTIRINLTNEDCHNDNTPYYIDNIQKALTWQDI